MHKATRIFKQSRVYLHILQDGTTVSLKDPAGMLEGLAHPSAYVSHAYGHLGDPRQAHLIVLLWRQGKQHTSQALT